MAPIWLKAARRSASRSPSSRRSKLAMIDCGSCPRTASMNGNPNRLRYCALSCSRRAACAAVHDASPARRCSPADATVSGLVARAPSCGCARISASCFAGVAAPTAARIESSSCSRDVNGRVAAAHCATHGECSNTPPSAAANSPGASAFNCSSGITRWAGTGAWRSNGGRYRHAGRSRRAGVPVRSRGSAPAPRCVPAGPMRRQCSPTDSIFGALRPSGSPSR